MMASKIFVDKGSDNARAEKGGKERSEERLRVDKSECRTLRNK